MVSGKDCQRDEHKQHVNGSAALRAGWACSLHQCSLWHLPGLQAKLLEVGHRLAEVLKLTRVVELEHRLQGAMRHDTGVRAV